MRQVLYRVLTGVPAKAFASLELLCSVGPVVAPQKFAGWTAWLVTAEQLRLVGLAGLAVFFAYLALLLWLRPESRASEQAVGFASAGSERSYILSGQFNAPVTITNAPPNQETGSSPRNGEIHRNYRYEEYDNGLLDMAGFTAHLILKLHYVPSHKRKLIIDAQEQNGTNISCYFAVNESLTLAVSDRHGEGHSLPVPFKDGVPIGQRIDLSLAVGSNGKETVLRVRVNDRTVAQRTVPISLGQISLPWKFSVGNRLNTGSDILGREGAGFDLYELAMWDSFLGDEKESSVSVSFADNWQLND